MAYLLQQLLTDTARRSPEAPALAAEDRSLSYAELDLLSNRLARTLQVRGVTRGDRVGILAPKSVAAVVCVYAALKAGACYVPLDPSAPDQRLRLIMADSGIGVVLADASTASRARELAGAVAGCHHVIVVDPGETAADPPSAVSGAGPETVPWEAVLAESPDPLPSTGAIDADLAYLLYTSGSTGVPKGVMISHRASLTFVRWAAACVGLEQQDRVCSPAPLHFDLSVFDIFASCRAAACMVVLPAGTTMFPVRLAQWLQEQRVSVWYSVPSVLTMLATRGKLSAFDLSRLRAVIFAGEVFPARHLSLLMQELPDARHLNWYGPTETNVCTWYEVPRRTALAAPVPIGRACANVEVFAVTGDGRRVSTPGDEGELFVRGSGLMTGYWSQPEKTREVLAPSPLQRTHHEPVYRTGDIVTLDEHGDYVFLGRLDGMVKTRGYRVELGEVETALYEHPAVSEAVVLPVPDELLGNRLRALICTEREISRDDLLEHCRRRLPGYMVPDLIEFCDVLPKTSTGKIDRVLLGSA